MTRDYTVATFVVLQQKILCLRHKKLGLWLPPGGHIEPNELPDEAAVREVLEETGVNIVLRSRQRLTETALPPGSPHQLARPEGVQLEEISPGHQHIDFIYFAKLAPGASPDVEGNEEGDSAGWYTLSELEALGVTVEVLTWARLALEESQEEIAPDVGASGRGVQ